MLIVLGTLLALLLVPVLGGSLRGLSTLRLRSGWMIALALGVQVVCISLVPTWPLVLLATAHGATYLLAAAFVWRNRRLPGLPLLALGGFLNAVTITLNHGTLPASAAALRRAGLPVTEDQFINSAVMAHPRLAFLGDVYASPSWLPLHNVYSIGDFVVLAGAVWAVQRSCRTVLARDPRTLLGVLPAQRSAQPDLGVRRPVHVPLPLRPPAAAPQAVQPYVGARHLTVVAGGRGAVRVGVADLHRAVRLLPNPYADPQPAADHPAHRPLGQTQPGAEQRRGPERIVWEVDPIDAKLQEGERRQG